MFNLFYAIDLKNIISFALGILAGILLVLSAILIIFSSNKKEKKKASGPTIEHMNEDKIREMVMNKQKDFITEVEDNDKELIKTAFILSTELIHEIASYYFPDSKRPEYEISLDEASDLLNYIVKRVKELFNKPILKKVKNKSLAQIADLIEKGKKISNNNTVKAGSEVISASKTIINAINPIYWVRKVVVNGALNIAMKKACKKGISIVGEEANKVYSKKLFNEEIDIKMNDDENFEEIISGEEN